MLTFLLIVGAIGLAIAYVVWSENELSRKDMRSQRSVLMYSRDAALSLGLKPGERSRFDLSKGEEALPERVILNCSARAES